MIVACVAVHVGNIGRAVSATHDVRKVLLAIPTRVYAEKVSVVVSSVLMRLFQRVVAIRSTMKAIVSIKCLHSHLVVSLRNALAAVIVFRISAPVLVELTTNLVLVVKVRNITLLLQLFHALLS